MAGNQRGAARFGSDRCRACGRHGAGARRQPRGPRRRPFRFLVNRPEIVFRLAGATQAGSGETIAVILPVKTRERWRPLALAIGSLAA